MDDINNIRLLGETIILMKFISMRRYYLSQGYLSIELNHEVRSKYELPEVLTIRNSTLEKNNFTLSRAADHCLLYIGPDYLTLHWG